MHVECYLADQRATEAFGERLAACCVAGLVVYLHGQLGAGKTTLVRGFLRALGHLGSVKSPTYTLLESYRTSNHSLYHLDLYRLADPQELEWIGVRELFDGESLCFIEWPEQGVGYLPEPDVRIFLQQEDTGRRVRVEAGTKRGKTLLLCLQQ